MCGWCKQASRLTPNRAEGPAYRALALSVVPTYQFWKVVVRMLAYVDKDHAPALGDIRALGAGDAIVLRPEAVQRKDWGRYADAIAAAVSRGAEVHQVSQEVKL